MDNMTIVIDILNWSYLLQVAFLAGKCIEYLVRC